MKENHFVINFRKKDENTKNTLLLLTRNNCASLFADKNFKFLTHNVFAINFVGVLMESSPFEQNYWNYLLFNWIKLFRRRNIKNTLLIPTRNNYISLFVDKQWIDCFWDTCHLNIFLKICRQISYSYCSCCKFCWNAYREKPFRTKSLKLSLV